MFYVNVSTNGNKTMKIHYYEVYTWITVLL